MRNMIVALLFVGVLSACNPATASTAPSTFPSATPAPATPAPTPVPTTLPTPLSTELATTAGTASPPVETSAAGLPPCTTADLKASHGLVDGAAGSVFTEVVMEAASACSIDAVPGLRLRDATGTAISTESASEAPGRLDLVGGAAYTSTIHLDNWCAPEPAFPVRLLVLVDGSGLVVSGSSFPDEGDVPECLAERGITLEGTPWVAAP